MSVRKFRCKFIVRNIGSDIGSNMSRYFEQYQSYIDIGSNIDSSIRYRYRHVQTRLLATHHMSTLSMFSSTIKWIPEVGRVNGQQSTSLGFPFWTSKRTRGSAQCPIFGTLFRFERGALRCSAGALLGLSLGCCSIPSWVGYWTRLFAFEEYRRGGNGYKCDEGRKKQNHAIHNDPGTICRNDLPVPKAGKRVLHHFRGPSACVHTR